MKNIKKISTLSFCSALLLAGCMTNKEHFQKIGLKEDGMFTAECVFAKSIQDTKTKENHIYHIKDKCSLNMEKIKMLVSHCVTKSAAIDYDFAVLMKENRNSLNKEKLAANFKIDYDTEYKKLRDIALGDNIEIISAIDLSKIDEDAARSYLITDIDTTVVSYFSLKDVPAVLRRCDIRLINKTGPYHDDSGFVDFYGDNPDATS